MFGVVSLSRRVPTDYSQCFWIEAPLARGISTNAMIDVMTILPT